MSFHSGRLRGLFLLPLATAGLVVCAGCSGAPTTSTDDPNASTAVAPANGRYTGEDLVRAVFFDVGPAAASIHDNDAVRPLGTAGKSPEELATMIERAAEEMTKLHFSEAAVARAHHQAVALREGSIATHGPLPVEQKAAAADAIVAHIGVADAAFFPRIAAELQSGDPLRVGAALDDAGRRLVEAQAALSAPHVEDLVLQGPLTGGPVHVPFPPSHVPVASGTILTVPSHVGTDIILTAVTDTDTAQIQYVIVGSAVYSGSWQLGAEGALAREQAAARIAAAYAP